MQTSPCGHRVVCRRCFVKTIQSAVAQRLLPLRCVICRARVNRLTSGTDTWRLQESASSYSMGTSKSWHVSNLMRCCEWGFLFCTEKNVSFSFNIVKVPGSTSAYSVDSVRVAQSSSLYSMSSGSSCVSGKYRTHTFLFVNVTQAFIFIQVHQIYRTVRHVPKLRPCLPHRRRWAKAVRIACRAIIDIRAVAAIVPVLYHVSRSYIIANAAHITILIRDAPVNCKIDYLQSKNSVAQRGCPWIHPHMSLPILGWGTVLLRLYSMTIDYSINFAWQLF